MGNGRSSVRSRRKSFTSRRTSEINEDAASVITTTNSPHKPQCTIDVIVASGSESYHLNIRPRTKIQHVKVILLAQYGIDLNQEQHQLYYNGMETQDENTLLDYNFISGHSLQIASIEQEDISPGGQLIDAALRNDLNRIRGLIANGVATVNASGMNRRNNGRRAIHAASEAGHEEIAKYLLNVGADVGVTDADGLTPLHVAASKGHLNVFRLLLKGGANLNDKVQGKKVLHFAAIGGHVPMLDLLESTCDVSEVTDDELTALHIAAGHGKLEAVLWLVEQGINFNLRDKRGRTAEDFAREGGHSDIATYLYHWALLQQKKFLHLVAQGNIINVVSFFKIGVDIECKTQDEGQWGHRAIHMAALHGHTEVVTALLYVGVRREAEDDMGNTAMHYAAAGGQIGTLRLLKSEECSVRVCNNLNMTPLHFAAAAGQLAAASWLLAQGVQANITSTTGFTAADLAEAQHHYALVDVLRKHHAGQMLRAKQADVISIDRKLGRGSFGDVYLATMNHRKIVVKKIKFNGEDQRGMELAAQEVLLLKHLQHPNIVTYMGSRIQNQHFHIRMEYCSGGDLAQRINQQQAQKEPFEEKLVVNWTSKIASALKYVHSRKVVHRDLKPANIFLSGSGAIKLGDFGLARIMGDTTFVRSYVGAPAYMSPEVLRNMPYDEKTDMWSFGCILYELMTLKRVSPQNKGEVLGHFSQEYKRLVVALLDDDCAKRPSSSDVTKLPFLMTDQSTYEHQQQHHLHLKELHKELERPMTELMKTILSSDNTR